MEIQETIPGATRMTAREIELMKVKDRLRFELRAGFRIEMVLLFRTDHIDHFVERANMAYDVGLLQGLKTVICYNRARQFILWMSHQSMDINDNCRYCPFLDSVYDVLDSFLFDPTKFHDTEVTTT
ncbi:hypothetical protein LCGC14_0908020 [marine sediment metagenome]|uniref:Uncharacterized protein n=1 Tax=marine sediment metagenome TaxID=412755 RepID=A0A0F9NUF5_9ZZZZ